MDNVIYIIFIHAQSPCANGPGMINRERARQVAECLTKLPQNVSLEHFPFLYWDFSFIVFPISKDPCRQPVELCVLYTKD